MSIFRASQVCWACNPVINQGQTDQAKPNIDSELLILCDQKYNCSMPYSIYIFWISHIERVETPTMQNLGNHGIVKLKIKEMLHQSTVARTF